MSVREPITAHQAADTQPGRAGMARRHKWMLLLAFEILVFGFAQSGFQPVRRGVMIEAPLAPNHVIT